MKKRLTPEKFAQLARSVPPDERAPYAFEKRIMANLKNSAPEDPLALWSNALWRAVAPCLGVMAVTAFFAFLPIENEARADSEIVDLEAAISQPLQEAFDPNVL